MLPSIEINAQNFGTVGIPLDKILMINEMEYYGNKSQQIILRNSSYYTSFDDVITEILESPSANNFIITNNVPRTLLNLDSVYSYTKTPGVTDMTMISLFLDNNSPLVVNDGRCIKEVIKRLREGIVVGTVVGIVESTSEVPNEPGTEQLPSKELSSTSQATEPQKLTQPNPSAQQKSTTKST